MKKVIMGLCIVAWVCVIVFLIVPGIQHTDSTYSGQDIFWSERKYETFKQNVKERIAADNLRVNDFSVIASEPPIIVNYSITVPYDYVFPYGKSTTHDFDGVTVAVMGVVAAILFILLPANVLFGIGKET